MATTSKLTYSSTSDLLEAQTRELEAEKQRKEQQIQKLEEVSATVAFQAGEVNQLTLEAQAYLTKAPFQSPLKHRLEPVRTSNPLLQMKELLAMAKQVQSGSANRELDEAIRKLNEEAGRTLSLALSVEDKVARMDSLILQLKALIEARKRNIQSTKEVVDEMK